MPACVPSLIIMRTPLTRTTSARKGIAFHPDAIASMNAGNPCVAVISTMRTHQDAPDWRSRIGNERDQFFRASYQPPYISTVTMAADRSGS